jgi:uncharacterized membrane protein YhhN
MLIGLAAVPAVADWIAVARRDKRLEYVCKPLTMLFLIAAALVLDPDDGAMRAWFVAALVLSLAGDVFLMLPRNLFVAGLASFLLAHLAYVGGFLAHGVDAGRAAAAAAVVAIVAAVVGGRILSSVRRGEEPELLPPVAVYIAVISAMVVAAAGTGRAPAIVGAALFYLSDALIAWNRFVRPLGFAPVAIMVSYHLAQASLVLSLT